MRFRLVSVALALCAVAGVAKADLAWDGVAQVPGVAGQYPGQYLVCPADTRLDDRYNQRRCVTGGWAPKAVGVPKLMSLQDALDLHFKTLTGLKAVALGPMQVFYRYGLDETRFGIAYKLIKQ